MEYTELPPAEIAKVRAEIDRWIATHYHQPSDEWNPALDWENVAVEVRADFLMALAVALGSIDLRHSAYGDNLSPPLRWTPVEGAGAYAIILEDPDAPSAKPFVHWLIWNIPPQTNSIAEGTAPKGVHGTNDFGKSGYKGPCPPPGTHRYSFKIFALDRELDLRSGAKRSQVDAAMKGHVIAQGELVGRYARKK